MIACTYIINGFILESRHVVVVDFDALDSIMKVTRLVGPFTAQVVNLVLVRVLFVQEFRNVLSNQKLIQD